MSRSAWKLVLVCLLLFALPLKGLAAGMVACGPGHGTGAAAALQAEAAHAGHAHVADGQHAHGGDTAPADDAATHGASGHGKCSSCAPCCSGAMMCGQALPAMPAVISANDAPATACRYHSAELTGPERPPR